jgi:hypothetical protein
MKKLIALFLVFSIICLYGNLYAKDRRGADLVIQKIDGQQVRGELIAVKQDSLLLKESETGADVSVDVKDISIITIVKKSKALLGAGLGFLISSASLSFLWYATDPEGFTDPEGGGPFVVALIFGIPGLLLGSGVGAIIGRDKTIKIEGKSDSEIKKILEDLRKKARVPDFQ